MKVKWLGHAAFLITAGDGTRIITDPYSDYPGINYKPIKETADIVLASHQHGDHFGGKVKGNPEVVTSSGSKVIKGIEIKGLDTYHDESRGSERGANVVFSFKVDGVNVCHLGDIGHDLSQSEVSDIGDVDVLLVPVGGFYTIDEKVATAICGKLKPSVVIPMHFKTDKLEFPINGVDKFLQGKSPVKRPDSSEVEVKQGQLPGTMEIVVLKSAM